MKRTVLLKLSYILLWWSWGPGITCRCHKGLIWEGVVGQLGTDVNVLLHGDDTLLDGDVLNKGTTVCTVHKVEPTLLDGVVNDVEEQHIDVLFSPFTAKWCVSNGSIPHAALYCADWRRDWTAREHASRCFILQVKSSVCHDGVLGHGHLDSLQFPNVKVVCIWEKELEDQTSNIRNYLYSEINWFIKIGGFWAIYNVRTMMQHFFKLFTQFWKRFTSFSFCIMICKW